MRIFLPAILYYIRKNRPTPFGMGSYETESIEASTVVEESNSGIRLPAVTFVEAGGHRRNPETWAYEQNPKQHLFDCGFTQHEHLDVFGLINMNGRVYDPWLGRMLSPDPVLQAPGNSQNYNRYTYAMNNPLKYTDPSGYTFGDGPTKDERDGAIVFNGDGRPNAIMGEHGEVFSLGFGNSGFGNHIMGQLIVTYTTVDNGDGTTTTTQAVDTGKGYVIDLTTTTKKDKDKDKKEEDDGKDDDEATKEMKALAWVLRNSPVIPAPGSFFGFIPNPFMDAEAIFIDVVLTWIAAEADAGVFFILVGEEAGKIVPYTETALGPSSEFGFGSDIGRVDISGNPATFSSTQLKGYRHKGWVSVSPFGTAWSVGASFAYSRTRSHRTVTYTGIQLGVGQSAFMFFGVGYNYGSTSIYY